MSDPAAWVHVETSGVTHLAGRLYATSGRGRTEACTILYDEARMAAPDRFALEPALTVSLAPQDRFSAWRNEYDSSRREIDRTASAIEHADLLLAQKAG